VTEVNSTLFVCITCRGPAEAAPPEEMRPGARLFAALEQQLAGDAAGLRVVPVECLSNCQRSCTAAVTASGKWTYVIGHLDPDQHVDDILDFARLHQAHADGLPVWRDRPAHVRKNTIARVPPMPLSKEYP
jgi:predicted metal-binding protein